MGARGNEIKKKALDRAGELVKSAMERKAPRSDLNKRHMADNIAVSNIERSDGIDYVEIGPTRGDNSEFFYSKFTEYGTSKMPAQHWAEKSVLENKREINRIIEEELRRGLEE
jgi:HK97 gp10 family phage protein